MNRAFGVQAKVMELKVLLLLVWLCSGPVRSSVIKRYLWFECQLRTWNEAQEICRRKYSGDLVTVVTHTDLSVMNLDISGCWTLGNLVWIGLHHDGTGWSWSDGIHSDYRNWSPLNSGSEGCVAVFALSKAMLSAQCSQAFPFLCYRHNVVLLQDKLSWEDAMDTCWNMRKTYNHTSFKPLSVEESELEYVRSLAKGANTTKVWVGLRFLAGSWFWSNGVPVSLSLPPCPEFHCGALALNTSSIEPTDCSEKLNVLCYGSGAQFSEF